MSQRTRSWKSYNAETIPRLLKEGRGSGEGPDYQPMLRVQDVPSCGLSSRILGWKTHRIHHLLSKLELFYFYCLDWASQVKDIREQFPLLPRDLTLEIARQVGIRHPRSPDTGEPIVMTTDFLITSDHGLQARAVKPSELLSKPRTREKLDLERLYWQVQGVDWGIVTEHEIPTTLALNVQMLHSYYHYPDYSRVPTQVIATCIQLLTEYVCAAPSDALHNITAQCDRELDLPTGTSLSVAYYLIATRQWLVDMHTLLDASRPLILQRVHLRPGAD